MDVTVPGNTNYLQIQTCTMKFFYLLAIVSLYACVAMAQTDTCIINLKNAGTEYDQGDYDQAINLLNITLKGCPLTKQDQIQANKLLLLCYIHIDNLEAANNAAATIMNIDPNYKPDKFKDDPKLSSLFEKLKPEPTLAAGIFLGINLPVIHVVQAYSVVHSDEATQLASYKSTLGYQFGIEIEKRAYKNLWVEPGFQFRNSGYDHTLDSVQNTTIFYSENLKYYDFPLSLKYYFLSGNLKPYVEAGADFSFLSRALSTTIRIDENEIVDRTQWRNNFDVGYLGAAGVSYGIKSFRLFGNIRYIYFPKLINKAGTRYSDDINLYKFYYVDDDFRMDNVQFNIGAYYILSYRIKKVK